MAHLWRSDAAGWSHEMLDERGTSLDGGRVLVRRAYAADGAWLLLAAPHARVALNGDTPAAGIAVLRDRDAIRAGDESVFFAARDAAVVQVLEAATAADPDVRCARCSRRFAASARVVRCPACTALHHQDDALACWTYAERCAACVEPASLEPGPRWSPEEL